MDFKIDTKTDYTIITPSSACLDANLAAAIAQQCEEHTVSGSKNFIINFADVLIADASSAAALPGLHEHCYNNGQSLVFIGLNDNLQQFFKTHKLPHTLNVAPTLAEAIDIISMEILERELSSESDEGEGMFDE